MLYIKDLPQTEKDEMLYSIHKALTEIEKISTTTPKKASHKTVCEDIRQLLYTHFENINSFYFSDDYPEFYTYCQMCNTLYKHTKKTTLDTQLKKIKYHLRFDLHDIKNNLMQ